MVQLFLRIQTQWRTGMSGVIGLDYPAIETFCRIRKQVLTPELFEGLQIMEMVILSEFNKQTS